MALGGIHHWLLESEYDTFYFRREGMKPDAKIAHIASCAESEGIWLHPEAQRACCAAP